MNDRVKRRSKPGPLTAHYIEGVRAQNVAVWIEDGMLQICGPSIIRQVPLQDVQWTALRTHAGAPATLHDRRCTDEVARFDDGAALHASSVSDSPQWLRLQEAVADWPGLPCPHGMSPSSGRSWATFAMALLLGVSAAAYLYGTTVAARHTL